MARASFQLPEGQLTRTMADLLQVAEAAERAQVFVLADAMARGVVDSSDAASPSQWLTDMAPCLEPGQASRVVQVARIITDPANACLRGVLAEGQVTVRGVHASVREARRVRLVLPDASWEDLLGYYLALADHCPSGVLRDLSKEIIAAYGEEKAPTDENTARQHESLSWFELPGGMTRVRTCHRGMRRSLRTRSRPWLHPARAPPVAGIPPRRTPRRWMGNRRARTRQIGGRPGSVARTR